MTQGYTKGVPIDTDPTLAANSNQLVPSQAAVVTYVGSQIANQPIITLAKGGTSANLTASNGGIFYSTASAGAILAGTATAGQVLRSGASTTPSWSTATYPATATGTGTLLRADGTNWVVTTSTYPDTNAVSTLLYASASNVMAALATGNDGVLITSHTGVPSWLAGGTTGQVLTATTNSPPTWASAGAPSTMGLVWIATQSASASATVNFDNLLTSTYNSYLIILEGVYASASTTLNMQYGTGGTPTYQATSYKNVTGGSTAGNYVQGTDNNSNRQILATVTINNVNSASYKSMTSYGGFGTAAGSITFNTNYGNWENSTVVTSVRFINLTGTITAGNFRLYGIKN